MVLSQLLEILCCPETKQPVRLATGEELAALNRAQAEGNLKTAKQVVYSKPLQAALIREDRAIAYRIEDEIPVMLIDEALQVQGLL